MKACFLYCRRSISYSELQEGHRNIIDFCKTFSSLYGSNCCTINMHLHGHLRTCIEDFGPVYSFWCFSYERLNGVLGSYPTNSHHISVQLCRRFLQNKIYATCNWPDEFKQEYLPLLHRFEYNRGSLIQTSLKNALSTENISHFSQCVSLLFSHSN